MEITCAQMDVLISFYIDNDLSSSLKSKVEEHLNNCPSCKAKYNIINSLFNDLNNALNPKEEVYSTNIHANRQYKFFKNNLSAYIDNELPPEENIKMKKFTINNKKARKDLEDTYYIKKLMSDSFRKTKSESRPDFSKNILRQLDLNEQNSLSFDPLIKVAFAFVVTVLLISAIVIYTLSL